LPGGTLVVSRAVKLFSFFKKRFDDLGFKDVKITGEEKDSLNWVINETKPGLILVGSGFYNCCTPYMMRQLLKKWPKLNIAAVSIFCEIPADLAMWFIINGVTSYVNFFDGPDEFYRGLNKVRDGKQYISPGVMRCIEMRREMPEAAGNITSRHIKIIRLLCNGFSGREICDVLHIAEQTLYVQKRIINTILNVRNENELIRVALFYGWIKVDELQFYGGDYRLNPKSK
jgi:DNA-binding NarL/FixJ family response regulator